MSLLIYNMHHKMLILSLLAQETFQFGLALLLSFSSKDSFLVLRGRKHSLLVDSDGECIPHCAALLLSL